MRCSMERGFFCLVWILHGIVLPKRSWWFRHCFRNNLLRRRLLLLLHAHAHTPADRRPRLWPSTKNTEINFTNNSDMRPGNKIEAKGKTLLFVFYDFDWIFHWASWTKWREQGKKTEWSGAKFDAVNKYSIQIWILISFICSPQFICFVHQLCVRVSVPHMHSEQKPNGEKKHTPHNLWPSIYCSFVSFASTTIELNKEINQFFLFLLFALLLSLVSLGVVRWLNYESGALCGSIWCAHCSILFQSFREEKINVWREEIKHGIT